MIDSDKKEWFDTADRRQIDISELTNTQKKIKKELFLQPLFIVYHYIYPVF